MAKHEYVVKVQKTHPRAYNPNRPITALVQNQLFHLSVAERHLEKRHRSGIDVYSIDTEGKAAEYIQHVTKKLHLGSKSRSGAAIKSKGVSTKSKAKRSKNKAKRKR
jgi:hypothetical protein